MPESRTGRRFPINLPIKLKESNVVSATKGITKDVSAAGVYIHAKAALKVGTPVEFDIILPPEVIGSRGEEVQIHCRGHVVRADREKKAKLKLKGKAETHGGVACVIDHYKFIRKGPGSKKNEKS